MKNIYKSLLVLSSFLLVVSCGNDDLEPTLAMNKDSATGIQNAADLASVLNGAYDRMSSSGYYARNVIVNGEVRGDNFYSNANSGRTFAAAMDYSPNGYGPWSTVYGVIAMCNIVIQADHASLEGDQNAISHTVGQAYALRALAHFDLLKDYGQHFISGQGGSSSLGVPYVKTYRDPANLSPSRDTVQSNVDNIVADFNQGISMMNSTSDNAQYMNKGAAYALLARAALYYGSVNSAYYASAASASKWVLDNWSKAAVGPSGYMSSWYTDNAVNHLFSIAASGTDNAGINGVANIYRGATYGDLRIVEGDGADDVHDVYEAADIRYTSQGMIGMERGYLSMLGKWPSMDFSDDNVVIRVEEMHLIYAEASLRSGDTATAKTYLNNVQAARGASLTDATLDNIILERRREFFGEGHRFYDIARLGMDIPLVDVIKQTHDDLTGASPEAGNYRFAYPISLSERNANPNIVQNYGY
tara:strand:- start:2186 stop:3604 length:1419 start_codon:yes stop_codon:yes gene_type:complete